MDEVVSINSKISQRLSALAMSQGLGVRELAEAMQVERPVAGRILRGTTPPTAAQLVLAARRLGVIASVITGEVRFDDANIPRRVG